MEIFKIIGVGITGAIAVTLVKSAKPDFTVPVTIAAGTVVLIMLINSLSSAVYAFTELVEKSGIDDDLFSGLLKIIGIGYLTEYAAGICTDSGSPTVANNVQLGGKITIFLMSLPILSALIDVIGQLVS